MFNGSQVMLANQRAEEVCFEKNVVKSLNSKIVFKKRKSYG